MMCFRELIAFRKELSVHRLVYSRFSLGWQIVLIYLIWLYLGVFGFLLFYFRSLPLMPWYAGAGLAPVLLWMFALQKNVLRVVLGEFDLKKEEWKKTGLDSVRRKELDVFLAQRNQNNSAAVLNMTTMVHRDSIFPDYRLRSPAIFASLLVGLGIATVSWLVTQGSSDEGILFLRHLTGILLAIALTIGLIEWMASQALREHKTYLRKALLKALNDCYFLYCTQEREQEAPKRPCSFWFRKRR